MPDDKIVAFAALTQGDLDTFGKDLRKVFQIDESPCFAELLRALDEADRRGRK